MSDREDRKLREVPVATYAYRHEAEFAGGFLKDAGIPYRLQIDDPALGISISTSAKIWVAAIDERRARSVLEGEGALESAEETDAEGPEDGSLDEARRPAPQRMPRRGRSEAEQAVAIRPKSQSDLTLRQRLISLGGSVAVASLLGVEAVREAGPTVTVGVALVGAALALVAMSGRAPGFLARILVALSGDAA